MICERCGTQGDNSARVCPRCGAPLRIYNGGEGVGGIRQGRMHEPPVVYCVPVERAPRSDRNAQQAQYEANRQGKKKRGKKAKSAAQMKPSRVNLALLTTILLGVTLVMMIALFVLAIRLPKGHLLLMRAAQGNDERMETVISLIGEEAAAEALWLIGQEELDEGYVARAIETYNTAYALYPEIEKRYERLLSLASAYEATGELAQAEATYTELYTVVDETEPHAYRYAIEIMLDQDRLFEATDLMQLAYEKTGELSFKSQREQRVPLPPTATEAAGRYMLEKTVGLVSSQEYDIYYLLNDEVSELPENGILYTEPLHLTEGTHTLRAVCVSTELVSDEINLKYTIYYPTPSAPKSRLLTGEYDNPRRVYFYMADIIDGKVVNSPNQDFTIYYTLDGTAPNSDSPIYTEEGILLPRGKVTVRAVAVNQYGKVSNEYVGTYKIGGRYALFFRDTEDNFKAFKVGETTYAAFKSQYGAGREETVDTPDGKKQLLVTYDWGTARFTPESQIMLGISTSYASMTGPRGTKVGMRVKEVTDLYRDMNMPENAKGNRHLYYDEYTGYGRYWKDTENTAHADYVFWREDEGTTTLTYRFTDGVVSRIEMSIVGADIH